MLQFIRPCVFLLWETLWNFNPTENDSRTMHLKIRYYNLSLPSTVIFLISASDLLPDFLNTGFVSALRTCCCVTGWNVSVSVCTSWHKINLHGTQFEVTWHGTNLLRWTEGSDESGSLFVSLPSPCWWCWVVAGAGLGVGTLLIKVGGGVVPVFAGLSLTSPILARILEILQHYKRR